VLALSPSHRLAVLHFRTPFIRTSCITSPDAVSISGPASPARASMLRRVCHHWLYAVTPRGECTLCTVCESREGRDPDADIPSLVILPWLSHSPFFTSSALDLQASSLLQSFVSPYLPKQLLLCVCQFLPLCFVRHALIIIVIYIFP